MAGGEFLCPINAHRALLVTLTTCPDHKNDDDDVGALLPLHPATLPQEPYNAPKERRLQRPQTPQFT